LSLSRLQITNVRNLRAVRLDNLGKVSVFYGLNGSGKTSVLEAIHILGMTRSFRGSSIKSLITHNENSCTVFGLVTPVNTELALGVQRTRTGGSQIKVATKPVRSVAQLVEHLPLQVLNNNSFDLLTGSPAVRRKFLNWGVFHVEHRFFGEWQRFQRCIKQRNMLLRRGKISDSELPVWTRELATSGGVINEFRLNYIKQLLPKFRGIMETLMPYMADKLELRYRQGWDKAINDIKVLVDGHSAEETLSRGQQKLVVSGLKLAQGHLMAELSRGRAGCTYLIDDLPSELDGEHLQRVCQILSAMEAQVFITCVKRGDIEGLWPSKDKVGMFHVEQGMISSEE
jgi:DNA replication and repair protein RecF